jgi:hypothetical protein
MIMPAAPPPVPQLAPATMKPPRKPMQPTFVSDALSPQQAGVQGQRSLIGGTPTRLGF